MGADRRAQQRAGLPPGGLPRAGGVAEPFPAGGFQQVRAQRGPDLGEGGVAADLILVARPGVAGRRDEGTLDVDLGLALDRGALEPQGRQRLALVGPAAPVALPGEAAGGPVQADQPGAGDAGDLPEPEIVVLPGLAVFPVAVAQADDDEVAAPRDRVPASGSDRGYRLLAARVRSQSPGVPPLEFAGAWLADGSGLPGDFHGRLPGPHPLDDRGHVGGFRVSAGPAMAEATVSRIAARSARTASAISPRCRCAPVGYGW